MNSKLNWNAKWIWVPKRPATELNIYSRFRKTFDLANVPGEALAHISADSRYMLYVNGTFVCRGIPMCDPLYMYYDTIDVAPYLTRGNNTVAVLVHHYGTGTSTYQHSGRAGFLFKAKIGDELITSDESWKCCTVDAYTQDVPRICARHMLQGFQEHFDARVDHADWNSADFDDSNWANASVHANKSPLPVEPWISMVPRDIPHYFEEERPAAAIYRVGEVTDARMPSDNDLSAKMHAEPMRKSSSSSIANAEGMIRWDDSFTTATQSADDVETCPSIIIDFGKEVTGMLRIDVEGQADAIVDIALAELPTQSGINHYWGDLIGMGVAHRYVLRNGRQSFETFGRFGFRYAQLTFRNVTEPVKIHRVSVLFSSYAVEHRGSFECSDEFLNETWKVGAYSAQCCMYDGWEDCPGREQRQWLGDGRVEAKICYACFGDTALTRKFLIQAGQSQRADGMTMMFYPGCGGIINTSIVDYNFQWISALDEYLLYAGDEDLLNRLYPKVILSLDWWAKYVNRDGLLENVPSHVYLDACTPSLDSRGIITPLNCFYLDVLRRAAGMAETKEDREHLRLWREDSERLEHAINEQLFDEKAGVYADSRTDGRLSERRSQHANLLPLLLDIVPMRRQPGVWKHVTNEDHLARTKADVDAGKTIAAAQPFFTHFLFEMFAKRGRADIILEQIRRLWKPLVNAGHGTFWEQWYDPREDVEKGTQTSMCHAWSGTPTFHLSSEVLGVRPTSAGFRTFDICPHTLGMKFARGIFPSVKGDISIAWENTDDRFSMEFTVPEDTIARVVLPVCNPKEVIYDGAKTDCYAVNGGWVEFTHTGPGRHSVGVIRSK